MHCDCETRKTSLPLNKHVDGGNFFTVPTTTMVVEIIESRYTVVISILSDYLELKFGKNNFQIFVRATSSELGLSLVGEIR